MKSEIMAVSSKPFLRWPGGKRWLVKDIFSTIQNIKFNRYIEPFLGGGAVFFALRPENAILSDLNTDLIITYNVVKAQVEDLIVELKTFQVDRDSYYAIRNACPESPLARAARFLYLNRTAFAGMYRVNKKGAFNVPYGEGRKVDILWEKKMLHNASILLQNVEVIESDFESIIDRASLNDLVYCDPTYTVAHNNNGFIRYNEKVFSWNDQVRLAEAASRAVSRGATVIISNAAHSSIAELYNPDAARTVSRFSCISCKGTGRKPVDEFLILLSPTI